MIINKKILSLITALIFSFSVIGCTEKTDVEKPDIDSESKIPSEPIRNTTFVMGTVLNVSIYDSSDESLFTLITNKVNDLDNILSANKTETEIDNINSNAGIKPVKVSDDTYTIINEGLKYSKMTDGKFDISIGPLVKLWSIGLPEAKVPTNDEIANVLPLIDYNSIALNEAKKTVFLPKKGMKLDLGGIAKGYTVDVISDLLTENGVNSAIIDLGGNIYTHGKKVTGEDWVVGIQNPDSSRGEIIGKLLLSNKSIVTSGIYERYIEKDGVKYHHILNPEDGYPYKNNIAGVTIISNDSIVGDALSTSVFAMGIEEGIKFIESLDNVDAIFIDINNTVHLTSRLIDKFELTDPNFTLAQ